MIKPAHVKNTEAANGLKYFKHEVKIKAIVDSWNDHKNRNANLVAQAIANKIKIDNDTSPDGTIIHLLLRKTAWTLIIKKSDYKRDTKIDTSFAFNRQEYSLPGGLLCVIGWFWHHDGNKLQT